MSDPSGGESINVEQARKLANSAIEQLAAALEQGQSETLKIYLAAMGRFHRYSLNDVILIALARPAERLADGQAQETALEVAEQVVGHTRSVAADTPNSIQNSVSSTDGHWSIWSGTPVDRR